VAQVRSEALPRIDRALNPVRAAISLIADGQATRIVIYAADGDRMLPAARLLARAAGVSLEPAWNRDGTGCDLILAPGTTAAHA
jgi:hypothetical protein